MGIEPTSSAWEADALPLCYTRFDAVIVAGLAPKSSQSWFGSPNLVVFLAMTQPGVIQIDETETREAVDTPWNVIVLNDPINLMSYVSMVFQRIFGYPRDRAERLEGAPRGHLSIREPASARRILRDRKSYCEERLSQAGRAADGIGPLGPGLGSHEPSLFIPH